MAQCGAWAVDPASSSLANISWVSPTRNECVLSPADARQVAVSEIHQPVVGGGQRAMLRIALSAEMAAHLRPDEGHADQLRWLRHHPLAVETPGVPAMVPH